MSQDRRDLDASDIMMGRAKDVHAESRLLAIAGTEHAVIMATRHGHTRGPRQEAMRRVAFGLGRRDIFASADAYYWACVGRYGGFIRRQARRAAVSYQMDADDAATITREWWFRAAIRFDPTGPASFPTYANYWGRKGVHLARQRLWTISLDAPLGGDDFCLYDVLPAIEPEPDDETPQLELEARIAELPAREERIVRMRGAGATFAAIGATFGFSSERARYLFAKSKAMLSGLPADKWPADPEKPPPTLAERGASLASKLRGADAALLQELLSSLAAK